MKRVAVLPLALASSLVAIQTPLTMKTFSGVQSLPVIAAAEQAIFQRQGLKPRALVKI